MKIFKYIFLLLTFIFGINNIVNCFEVINGTNRHLEIRYYLNGLLTRLSLAPRETEIFDNREQENNKTNRSVLIFDTDEFKLQIDIIIRDVIIILKEDVHGQIYALG